MTTSRFDILLSWLQTQCDLTYTTTEVRSCKHLDLSSCGITTIPDEIDLFENLISIDLSNNLLESLPDTIANIGSLVNINLRRNSFSDIPKTVMQLPIKSLNLSANRLVDIETLSFMKSIRVLDISANQISMISSAFDSLEYLRVLNLSFNYIDSLQFITPALRQLERLNIANNLLTSVDSHISLLENLQYADFSSNAIARIDKAMYALDIETLELYDNDIKTIRFEQLELLAQLNMDNNPLKELSFSDDFAPLLEELSIEGCALRVFHLEQAHTLHTINLSNNKLSDIPLCVYGYSQLLELDLSDNRIKSIDIDALKALPLKTLYIEDNDINETSASALREFGLDYLDIQSQSITIEPCQDDDIDALAHLLSQLFSIERDFNVDFIKQKKGLQILLNDVHSHIAVAKIGNKIVGMATMQRLISTAEGGYVGHIEDVVVDDEYRNRGIGTLIIKHMVSVAKNNNYLRLQLAADNENAKALIFYQKRSFSTTSLTIYRNRAFS